MDLTGAVPRYGGSQGRNKWSTLLQEAIHDREEIVVDIFYLLSSIYASHPFKLNTNQSQDVINVSSE